MSRSRELDDFIQAALECSIFADPLDPGLSHGELTEAGRRAGYQDGETLDAMRRAEPSYVDGIDNLLPAPHVMTMWRIFSPPEEPDFRNLKAFDFLWTEFESHLRNMGANKAGLDRAGIVERGAAAGLPRHDVEVAATALSLSGQLVAKDGMLRLSASPQLPTLPSTQRKQPYMHIQRREARQRAMPIVKDIVERRSDGRPKQAEPLDAFADALEQLELRPFRAWWVQMVGELRRADAGQAPISVCVLSAALVEGALTFVVRHAQSIGSATLGSKTFTSGQPRTWRVDDLVNSAAAGSGTAILGPGLKVRAESLIQVRQRIHAGRMLEEFPRGVPDLRPEEARGARQTAEDVVRAVLDWLQRFPPTP